MRHRLVALALAGTVALCGGGALAQPACVYAGPPVAGAPALILPRHGNSLWSLREPSYTEYLRFYPGGRVIGVSSTGTPGQIRRWFKTPYENTGTYVQHGARLTFALTDKVGRVDYDGVIEGARLRLFSCSQINGARSTDVYVRVAER